MTDPRDLFPRPRFTFTVTAGNLMNAVILVGGLVWGVSAFATKANSDSETDKTLAVALRTRLEVVDARSQTQENRLVAIETSIQYIEKSVTRIERAITRP